MQVTETKLKDCFIIEPTIFGDERGYFFETFNKEKFKELTGKEIEFVQDNEAFSNRGVLRGLHFQKGEFSQAKLVRVVKGKVLDVVVDVRPNSKTFGEVFSCVLSSENKKQLFVPRGFAHGYSVLEDNTVFVYKCDNFYQPKSEGGIRYNDEILNIDWMLSENEIAVSEKDKVLQAFNELEI
jgi:dTDP-4-dehydrorhamnose 3,5-epimerase